MKALPVLCMVFAAIIVLTPGGRGSGDQICGTPAPVPCGEACECSCPECDFDYDAYDVPFNALPGDDELYVDRWLCGASNYCYGNCPLSCSSGALYSLVWVNGLWRAGTSCAPYED